MLAVEADEGDVRRVGQPLGRFAENDRLCVILLAAIDGIGASKCRFESVAKRLQVAKPLAAILVPQFERRLQPDRQGDGFRARPQSQLLDASVQEG